MACGLCLGQDQLTSAASNSPRQVGIQPACTGAAIAKSSMFFTATGTLAVLCEAEHLNSSTTQKLHP